MPFIVIAAQLIILAASVAGIAYAGMLYFVGMRQEASVTLLVSLIAIALCVYWIKSRGGRLKGDMTAQIRAVAPQGFAPRVEVQCLNDRQYVGISPEMGRVVVIDKKRGVARCEPMEWVQRWEFQESSGGFTFLTFWFRDFSLPSMRICVPSREIDTTASKLRHALKF